VEFQVFLEVAGGSIELHVKSQKGEPAAVLDVTKAQNANKAINNWTNQATKMTTKVTGLQTVYLVYKTEESQSYKLNFFRFLAEN
jgi:5-hydroxyisourate hydrolase-like protein (transthyretin family)